ALAGARVWLRVAAGADRGAIAGAHGTDGRVARGELREPAGGVGADGVPVWDQFVLCLAGPVWAGAVGVAPVRHGGVYFGGVPAAVVQPADAGELRAGLSALLPAVHPAEGAVGWRNGSDHDRYSLGHGLVRKPAKRLAEPEISRGSFAETPERFLHAQRARQSNPGALFFCSDSQIDRTVNVVRLFDRTVNVVRLGGWSRGTELGRGGVGLAE